MSFSLMRLTWGLLIVSAFFALLFPRRELFFQTRNFTRRNLATVATTPPPVATTQQQRLTPELQQFVQQQQQKKLELQLEIQQKVIQRLQLKLEQLENNNKPTTTNTSEQVIAEGSQPQQQKNDGPRIVQQFHQGPVTKRNPSTVLMEDGTLLVRRRSRKSICSYFVDPNNDKDNKNKENDEDIDAQSIARFLVEKYKVPIRRLHYHFDDCTEGQLGNRLGEHYGRYLLANSMNLPYTMTCGDTLESNRYETLFMGSEYVGMSVLKLLQVDNTMEDLLVPPLPLVNLTGQPVPVQDLCRQCPTVTWYCKNKNMEAITPLVRQDMAKLAFTTVGQSFEPDDVVIHLRLGDSMRGTHDEFIGLLPFASYAGLLFHAPQPIQTISIVTQPFDSKSLRVFDRSQDLIDRSRLVATAMQQYLQATFPDAKVNIHNAANETTLHSYTRIIRAKKIAICGSSTFCTYPVLGLLNPKEAIGYVFDAQKHCPWAKYARYPNIKSWIAPRLANHVIPQMTDEELLHWLRHTPADGNRVYDSYPLPTTTSTTMHLESTIETTTRSTTTTDNAETTKGETKITLADPEMNERQPISITEDGN